ncbi:hypothetical protein D3C72_1718490 [compost metagenome]
MLDAFEGILLSTSWAVVKPCLAKSSALKMDRGVAVSETRRLMEEPVTSTRCMAGGSPAVPVSCAMAAWPYAPSKAAHNRRKVGEGLRVCVI